jgi:hypothetical protein
MKYRLISWGMRLEAWRGYRLCFLWFFSVKSATSAWNLAPHYANRPITPTVETTSFKADEYWLQVTEMMRVLTGCVWRPLISLSFLLCWRFFCFYLCVSKYVYLHVPFLPQVTNGYYRSAPYLRNGYRLVVVDLPVSTRVKNTCDVSKQV